MTDYSLGQIDKDEIYDMISIFWKHNLSYEMENTFYLITKQYTDFRALGYTIVTYGLNSSTWHSLRIMHMYKTHRSMQ